MNWKFRVQEWLADRISWVQYPQIRPLSTNARRRLFATDMHWTTRVLLVMSSLAVLGVAIVVLSGVGLIVWAAITAHPLK